MHEYNHNSFNIHLLCWLHDLLSLTDPQQQCMDAQMGDSISLERQFELFSSLAEGHKENSPHRYGPQSFACFACLDILCCLCA